MEHFSGEQAQLVVCDGAPDVTGLHDIGNKFNQVRKHLKISNWVLLDVDGRKQNIEGGEQS